MGDSSCVKRYPPLVQLRLAVLRGGLRRVCFSPPSGPGRGLAGYLGLQAEGCARLLGPSPDFPRRPSFPWCVQRGDSARLPACANMFPVPGPFKVIGEHQDERGLKRIKIQKQLRELLLSLCNCPDLSSVTSHFPNSATPVCECFRAPL